MPAGQPTKLTKEVFDRLPEFLSLGLTDGKIAEILGVDQSTISQWKKRNKEFFISYNLEKAKADNAVEKSLFRRALGYDKTLMKGEKAHEQHYPADVQAQIYWLNNRRSEAWRTVQQVEGSTQPVEIVFNFPRPPVQVKNEKEDEKVLLGARK